MMNSNIITISDIYAESRRQQLKADIINTCRNLSESDLDQIITNLIYIKQTKSTYINQITRTCNI